MSKYIVPFGDDERLTRIMNFFDRKISRFARKNFTINASNLSVNANLVGLMCVCVCVCTYLLFGIKIISLTI